MTDKTKTIFVVGVLTVLIVGMSGCTLPANPITGGQTSQVKAYAEAFNKSIGNGLGKNETLKSSKLSENGSDSMRLTYTTVNTSSSGLTKNGTTTTVALNIRQFSSTDEATKFYDSVSFGYTPVEKTNDTGSILKPGENPYKDVMGHDPTVSSAAYKLDSFTFVTAQMSIIFQQDEFVIWGTASVMPK